MATTDLTPDWLHQLLPNDGGKVSVTVQGTATPTTTNPTNQLAAQALSATPQAAPAAAVAPAPPPAPAAPTNKMWFNPYTGKTEAITGMNAAGIITDPNAFWNYYSNYGKSAGLASIAAGARAQANAYATPINYAPIVPSNPNYQTGLANLNMQRYLAALGYGDDSIFGDMGLSAEQKEQIKNNPVSQLAQMKRDYAKANYDTSSGLASHGLWSSGARRQGLQNNLMAHLRSQTAAQQNEQIKGAGWDAQQRDLYQSIKNDLEKNQKYDPNDVEHNKILESTTNAAYKTMVAELDKFTKNLVSTSSHSITDMRTAMHAILDTKRKYGGKVDPKSIAYLDARYGQYVNRIKYLQNFRATH